MRGDCKIGVIYCLFHYRKATAEVKELLKDSLNWKNYTELDYYKGFDALY